MADRFDDIAFRIVRDNFGEVPRVAAILRAAAELAKPEPRPGVPFDTDAFFGKKLSVYPPKPVAGEWNGPEDAPSTLCLVDTGACVANVYVHPSGLWGWNVYNASCDALVKEGHGCKSSKAARSAVVEWAREHATELDWRLPDPVAQREQRPIPDLWPTCGACGHLSLNAPCQFCDCKDHRDKAGSEQPAPRPMERREWTEEERTNAAIGRAYEEGVAKGMKAAEGFAARLRESAEQALAAGAIMLPSDVLDALDAARVKSERPAHSPAAPDLAARAMEALRAELDSLDATCGHDDARVRDGAMHVISRVRALLAEYDAQPTTTNTERK